MAMIPDPSALAAPSTASPGQRRIVIFRIGSLGDSLVAIPALKRLRLQEPTARMILLTNAPVDGGVKAAASFQVLQGTGLIDDFIEYQIGLDLYAVTALMRKLRALRPHRTVYLMPMRSLKQRIRDMLFLRLAGCHKIEGLAVLSSENQRLPPDDSGMHESEASRLFRSVGGVPDTLRQEDFSLEVSALEREAAARRLTCVTRRSHIVAISIGTKSPTNDWGQANWEAMLHIVATRLPQTQLVLLGSADEYMRCHALGRLFGEQVINLCGKLSPRESAAVLTQCDLFIGHDSGPMHLAASAGVPLIAIFSARNPKGIWYPFGKNVRVFYNDVECAGCGLDICSYHAMRCIRGIGVVDVADAALEVLSGTAERPGKGLVMHRAITPIA